MTKSLSRQDLETWRKNDNFFCPQCKGKLVLKVGKVVIPHFAHLSQHNCTHAFSEGESADHLAGKQQLYEWLSKSHQEVIMEATLTSIAQRPDVLVNQRYAIEFQCSPLSKDLFSDRTRGYHTIGIQPIWILRTPPTLLRYSEGLHLISLTKFHQLFIPHRPMIGQTLLTYDPTSERFIYISHLLPVQQNQFIAKVKSLPLDRQRFPFLSVNPPTKNELRFYQKVYENKRRQYLRTRVLRSRKGIKDRFLRVCYHHEMYPELLPKWIGFPTAGSEIFEGHAAEWQALFMFHLIEHGRGDASLEAFIQNQPNIDQQLAREAVDQYLNFLDQLELSPMTRECLQKSVPVEILFETIFPHFLAKRYEN